MAGRHSKKFAVHVLFDKATSRSPSQVWAKRKVGTIIDALGKKVPSRYTEISILFTSDQQIRKINKEWRKKDKATDVLSFPSDSPTLPQCCLGDVVISLPTAKRQAKELGASLHDEVLRLLIHGILHLLGYDHENVPIKEALRMQRLEDKLLARLS